MSNLTQSIFGCLLQCSKPSSRSCHDHCTAGVETMRENRHQPMVEKTADAGVGFPFIQQEALNEWNGISRA